MAVGRRAALNTPSMPDTATLANIGRHVREIIHSGRHIQRKTLVEGLIEHIAVTGPNRFVPTVRIPQPTHDTGAETDSAVPTPAVRAMTQVVEVPGIEPGSSVAFPGLLRAQSTVPLLGPTDLVNKVV